MLLIKDIHTLYTGGPDPRELHGVHLEINDGIIKGIHRDLPDDLPTVDSVIEGSNMVIMPGLINMHHHFYQTLTRNLPGAQQAKLFDWLVYLYPIWANLSEQAVVSSTTVAAAELLLSGCTTAVDHFYLYPNGRSDLFDVEADTARDVGLRMALCRGSMSLSKKDGGLPPDHVTQTVDEILEASARAVDKYHSGEPGAMTQIILAPCSPFSVTRDLMIESKKLATEKGVLVHTHLAETEDEEDFCQEMFGCRPLDYLEQVGWLDHNTFLAHMVWLNDEEIKRVAKAKTGIAHCPTSNMRLGSGIAPIVPLLKAGARVGIAVDGSASNDSSHMLAEARQTLLLQRVKYGADALGARDVLHMATWGGAEILNRPDLGHIDEGKTADVIGITMDRIHYSGALSDPLAATMFCFTSQVDLSIVNGNVVVEDGQLTTVDLPEVIENHNNLARTMIS